MVSDTNTIQPEQKFQHCICSSSKYTPFLQNFVAIVCQVLAIPCKVCTGIGIAICPQLTFGILPVVCLVCAAKPLSVEGFTEDVQSHNVTIDGFIMRNRTQTN